MLMYSEEWGRIPLAPRRRLLWIQFREIFISMAAEDRYKVYRVVNNLPGAKEDKKYYMISNLETDEKVKSRIRGMVTSKTAAGGIKQVAKDMKAAGQDYKEDFSLKVMAKGMDKTAATQLRNRLTKKSPKGKVYNSPRSAFGN